MTRQTIADALSAVAGVSGHPTQPASPVPFQGWPEWQRTVYENVPTCGATPDLTEWEVVLVLPALDTAGGDALRDTVAQALSNVGSTTEARPDSIPLQADAPNTPVIRYSLTINGG